jgi:hypothetical protein
MALITSSVSSSFAETGSFGHLKITGDLDQNQHGTIFGTGSFGKIIAVETAIGGPSGAALAAKTSGTSGEQGGQGAGGGTGSKGSQGAQGGTGSAGSTGATGGTGSTGNQGGTGGTGGAGATGGTGGTGDAGGAGGQGAGGDTGPGGPGGAQGGTGGTGGTGGAGAQGSTGSQGAGGGTGGTGGTGAKGGGGPTGPTGTDGGTVWDDNQTLSWTGTKLLTGDGTGFRLKFDGIAPNNYGLVLKAKDRPMHTSTYGATGRIWFYGSGNTYPSAISDRRSKKYLTPLSGTLDAKSELEHLDGKLVTFNKLHFDSGSIGWSSSEDPEGYDQMDWNTLTGYIAQDVLTLTGSAFAKRFVHRLNEDENKVDMDHGYYRMDYNGLNVLSNQAIIDIDKDVTDLEARVTTLEG